MTSNTKVAEKQKVLRRMSLVHNLNIALSDIIFIFHQKLQLEYQL